MCASFGQLLHSSWEIPVLFSVITIVTGVQIGDNGCDLAKTDVDWFIKMSGGAGRIHPFKKAYFSVSGTCFPLNVKDVS